MERPSVALQGCLWKPSAQLQRRGPGPEPYCDEFGLTVVGYRGVFLGVVMELQAKVSGMCSSHACSKDQVSQCQATAVSMSNCSTRRLQCVR